MFPEEGQLQGGDPVVPALKLIFETLKYFLTPGFAHW